MAEKVIKEHYVPRRYLKRFADNKKFTIYDKEKMQKRPGNIENYACERFFYDINFEALKEEILKDNPEYVFDSEIVERVKQINEQFIEDWFGENVETWLFNPIDNIVTLYRMSNPEKINTIEVLSEEMMNLLSLYISIQYLRTKEFREYLTEVFERLPLMLINKFFPNVEGKELQETYKLKIKNENYKKLFHAIVLMDEKLVNNLALDFRKKIWMVGYNKSNLDFITSDNPIIHYGRKGKHGFNSEGIEIAFPISTELILILKDPKYFGDEEDYHRHFLELEDSEVRYYNSFQVLQSYRYVFDKNGNFPDVEKIMKMRPELQNTKRNKLKIY